VKVHEAVFPARSTDVTWTVSGDAFTSTAENVLDRMEYESVGAELVGIPMSTFLTGGKLTELKFSVRSSLMLPRVRVTDAGQRRSGGVASEKHQESQYHHIIPKRRIDSI